MNSLLPVEALNWFAPAIGLLLAIACAGFLLRFIVPGLLIGRELGEASRQLRKLQQAGTLAPDAIANGAMRAPRLAAVWREYSHTLHLQQATPQIWRATAGAESFFSTHVLVDTPLKTEFYKHLPGILTGLGILGTFSGLILGLSQFAVSSDASAVRGSLNVLIQSVGHAFQVSAAAIGLAMLFTWIEKSLVAALYRRVTGLVQLIDGLYESGSGEDYLARLVRSSETSSRQMTALREELVQAVRQAFEDMQARQREAEANDRQQLGGAVAQTLVDGLREPLRQLAASLDKATHDPGQKLAERLDKTMAQFAASLERQAAATADAAARRQQEDGARTGALLNELTRQVGALGVEIQRSGVLARQGAEHMMQGSHAASTGLEQGVALLRAACADLSACTRELNATTASLAEGGRRVELAASALDGAATREQEIVAAHARLQESLASALGALRGTVDAARREATLSADLIARLEASAQHLGRAGQSAEHYLAGVNAVLEEAHAAFARNVERTLHTASTAFQHELAEAVDHLKGGIDELGDALDGALNRN